MPERKAQNPECAMRGDVRVKPSGKRIAIVSGLSVMSKKGEKV
jgi:hypothetical protein